MPPNFENSENLYKQLVNCLQAKDLDQWTRPNAIRKIYDAFNVLTVTEVRDNINILESARERFYENRDELLDNIPRGFFGPTLSVMQTNYIDNAINDIIRLENVSIINVYPFAEFFRQQRHPYYGDYTDTWGTIDKIGKYIECHIELYQNILQLRLKEGKSQKSKRQELPETLSFTDIYTENEMPIYEHPYLRRKGGKKKRKTNKNNKRRTNKRRTNKRTY